MHESDQQHGKSGQFLFARKGASSKVDVYRYIIYL